MAKNVPEVVTYGPFHRVASPSQTVEYADKQVRTGEVWGKAARGSDFPSIKAYRGALPPGVRGIEFVTQCAPYPNPHPILVQWYDSTPCVVSIGNGYVSIRVTVTRNTQVQS